MFLFCFNFCNFLDDKSQTVWALWDYLLPLYLLRLYCSSFANVSCLVFYCWFPSLGFTVKIWNELKLFGYIGYVNIWKFSAIFIINYLHSLLALWKLTYFILSHVWVLSDPCSFFLCLILVSVYWCRLMDFFLRWIFSSSFLFSSSSVSSPSSHSSSFWNGVLTMSSWLVWNLLCTSYWLWTHWNPPVAASQVLGLKVCITTLGPCYIFWLLFWYGICHFNDVLPIYSVH